jgi:integrase/recombinase XerC
MKLLQAVGPKGEKVPNFFQDSESGFYYTKKMVKGRVVWRSTGETAWKRGLNRHYEIMAAFRDKKSGWDDASAPTLNEWWKDYRAAKNKMATTWEREVVMMEKHILPQFGKASLDEITKNQLERYLNWRRKKAAESTVTREQALLVAVFNAAIDEDLLQRNPLRGVKRSPAVVREKVLSQDEQRRLYQHLNEDYQRWFTLVLGTGMRVSESVGLRAPDINLPGLSLRVLGKGDKKRHVPLLDPLLVKVLEVCIAERPEGLLFPRNRRTVNKVLKRAAKDAGVTGITPHVLRHTFATRYLQSGGDIYVLSKILGHASVSVTERVYAHLEDPDTARLSQHVKLGLVIEKVVEDFEDLKKAQ